MLVVLVKLWLCALCATYCVMLYGVLFVVCDCVCEALMCLCAMCVICCVV